MRQLMCLLVVAMVGCAGGSEPAPQSSRPVEPPAAEPVGAAPAAAEPAAAEPIAAAPAAGDPCAGVTPGEHLLCVADGGRAVTVVAFAAPTSVDPCATASCPTGTRCESAEGNVYRGSPTTTTVMRLPYCIGAPVAAGTPVRDPCAAMICPSGYFCTAPSDRPSCQAHWS